MKEKIPVIRPTDDEALALSRRLVRGARHGALAVIDPETGFPFASRVLLGTDQDCAPVMLGSLLATHTRALIADARGSLLVGEPGKGDPLAWPRLTLLFDAERIKPDTESHLRLRARFLRRHPKSRLYVDFPDFSFFRLVPKTASLNGGFGKAYKISGDMLVLEHESARDAQAQELQFLQWVDTRNEGVADLLMKHYFGEKTVGWRIAGIDAAGIDLARREQLVRFEPRMPVGEPNGLIALYDNILKDIR